MGNWLERQLNNVALDVANWPEWKRREVGLSQLPQISPCSSSFRSTVNREPAEPSTGTPDEESKNGSN